jgi:hypothetical protein
VDYDEFKSLVKQGKVNEVRRFLELQREKLKFAPTSITFEVDGHATFRHKRRRVEPDTEGNWRLVQPAAAGRSPSIGKGSKAPIGLRSHLTEVVLPVIAVVPGKDVIRLRKR